LKLDVTEITPSTQPELTQPPSPRKEQVDLQSMLFATVGAEVIAAEGCAVGAAEGLRVGGVGTLTGALEVGATVGAVGLVVGFALGGAVVGKGTGALGPVKHQ
jgi:hypothetical protein